MSGAGFVFPTLTGGTCRFTRAATGAVSAAIVTTPLSALSPTLVSCSTPAGGVPASYSLAVLQNGLSEEPSLFGAVSRHVSNRRDYHSDSAACGRPRAAARLPALLPAHHRG